MQKKDILSMTYEKLAAEMVAFGLPAFRAKQIFEWLHAKRVRSFAEMTNLSTELREKLSGEYFISDVSIEKKLISKIDGTVKYLFALGDGEHIEGVRMGYKRGGSLCISTQAGCRMGCTFCASTLTGLARNLTPGEMLSEVYLAERDAEESGEKVASIVLMGIGEPLDNFDNVMDFLEMVTDARGFDMGMRHISLSTCGLVDKINELAKRKLQLTLSISLHASNDETRRRTMPVAKSWSIKELMEACRAYFETTGRRISFEYALIEGVNDRPEHAVELSRLLKGSGAHVNLIPVNQVKETNYRRGKRETLESFAKILEQQGVNVTVRRELGTDISAACGQLRRSVMIDSGEEKT